MKKVLFFYPDVTGQDESKPLYQGMPLSVMAIAAQMDCEHFEILIIDERVEKDVNKRVIEWVDENVVCVGISSMTGYQIKSGLAFAEFIRNINADIPIVWGGWHPSLMPEQTIMNDFVDIVIIGQGEITFNHLVKNLACNGELYDVPNLIYKKAKSGGEKQIIRTLSQPLDDLTKIKPIENAYRHVEVNNYIQPLWGHKKVLGYESSRGCPRRCDFCSIQSVYCGRWRALPAETVADGIEYIYNNYGIEAVHFFDNNFFVSESRVKKFASIIKQRQINVKWDGTVAVEQLAVMSDELIEQLRENGFFRAIVGVESGDQEVLGKINKRHNNAQVLEAVKKCVRHGIMVSMSFMVGFPWNPEKDLNETINLINEIKAIDPGAEILLFVFSPYVGTNLQFTAAQYGMKFPEDLSGWAKYTYERVNTPWISKNLLRKINRYISFFGTKDMSAQVKEFLTGKG